MTPTAAQLAIWRLPSMGVPPNGWFRRGTPIKMDDFGVPLV